MIGQTLVLNNRRLETMKAAASSKRDAGFGGGSVGKSLSAQHSAKAAADFYGSGGIGRG